jgi:5'-AMP-activated protein kinase catalytic alpha subunit
MLLDRNGDLKLVDFGLSTKYKDTELLNQPCGTLVYAAPEVLQGKEYHGMLCDVWSSGIVLFGMLSGYLPFSDSDDEVNKKNIIKGVIDYPKFISPFVKDLLKKMLEVNPMKRCTLKDILEHKWFNLIECRLIPGIIVGYNKIPIDDDAVLKCEEFGFDKNNVRKAVLGNLFNKYSAIYYLVIRRKIIEGKDSVSDLFSEKFVQFALDEDNIVLDLNKFKKKNNEDEKNENENLNKKHSGVIGAIRNLQNSKKNLTPLSNKNSSDFSETLDSNFRGISKQTYSSFIIKMLDETPTNFNKTVKKISATAYKNLFKKNTSPYKPSNTNYPLTKRTEESSSSFEKKLNKIEKQVIRKNEYLKEFTKKNIPKIKKIALHKYNSNLNFNNSYLNKI